MHLNRSLPFFFICVVILFITVIGELSAQDQSDSKGAFVRSLVIPGWGHYYAGEDHRLRGHAHLGAEITLITTYFGLVYRVEKLLNNYTSLAELRSGVELAGRDRRFKKAVGDFDSIHLYNDYQLRSRNWHQLIEATSENYWNWSDPQDRANYRALRSRRDRVQNNLPVVMSLMVLNRVIAAVSSANRVNRSGATATGSKSGDLYLLPYSAPNSDRFTGLIANWSIQL